MKITVLVENTSSRADCEAEHGLSLYIETGDRHILFDMGQSDLFSKNAEKLGVNLENVDMAVLSHGHYDHGGGLKRFLEVNAKASVYINQYAFEPHYNGVEKYIGLDKTLENNSRFVYVGDALQIDKGLALYSCNDREQKYHMGSFGLNMEQDGVLVPDDFRHEQYLLIEENGKRVLISGCSHKGIMDIVDWFRPDVLVGGFHFSKLPLDDTLKGYAEYLDSFHTEYYTCHCTGTEQYKYMRQYITKLQYISVGQMITI